MESVSCLSVSSQNWDFAYGYLVSGRFTAIYNLLVLLLVFVLGLRVSQISSRCKEIDRFVGEFRRKSVDLGNGFCSRCEFGGVCRSEILSCGCGFWKFVKGSKLLPGENLKGAEELGVERGDSGDQRKEVNFCMDCRNGNCSHMLKARKSVDLGNGLCLENDVGVCCSKILSFGCGFWKSIKNWILSVKNSNADGEIVIGRGNSSCQGKEEGLMDCGNGKCSITFKEREEEAAFEECREEDFVEFKQKHQNAAYLEYEKEKVAAASAADLMDCRHKNYHSTSMVRKFMKEDNDEEEEGSEEYEGEDLMGLKNAFRIERERRNAAYLELEKERMAAASATNETMVMIQRLQNEKSLTEIEARQYRLMAEQKQLYDQEVIRSLQWIISKHESERSILERQLKQCRKRLLQVGLSDEIVGETEEHQDG